jgi:hypothetical protein
MAVTGQLPKLFPCGFVVGEWQDNAVQTEMEDHNSRARLSRLSGGGEAGREYWWHVTEVTLDHLRPSPKWIKESEELAFAKECEAIAARGSQEMAKRRSREEQKLRMLQEVAELFKHDWPRAEKERPIDCKSAKSEDPF